MAGLIMSTKEDSKKVRTTISFPAEQYAELERMAHEKKVSFAWVVREAVDNYLADQWPLLGKGKEGPSNNG